jgi:hypothetical protein
VKSLKSRLTDVRAALERDRAEQSQVAGELESLQSQRRTALRDGRVADAKSLAGEIAQLRLDLAARADDIAEMTAADMHLAAEQHLVDAQAELEEKTEQRDLHRAAMHERMTAGFDGLLDATTLLSEAQQLEMVYASDQRAVRDAERAVIGYSGDEPVIDGMWSPNRPLEAILANQGVVRELMAAARSLEQAKADNVRESQRVAHRPLAVAVPSPQRHNGPIPGAGGTQPSPYAS